MVAVVERGGFLWFCNFLLVLWLLYFFFLSRKPAPWWSIAGSLMVVPGGFLHFVCFFLSLHWLFLHISTSAKADVMAWRRLLAALPPRARVGRARLALDSRLVG